MKNKHLASFLFLIAICAVALRGAAFAEDSAGSPVKLGISAGPLFHGVIGPTSITTGLLRIKFEKDSFKCGAYAGLDLLYYPSGKHSLSLGLSYEMRNLDLRVVDLKIYGLASMVSSVLPIPFLPPYLLNLVYLFPVEKLVGTTALSEHYLVVPLSYRFHFHTNLYFGLGVDLAMPVQARAEYQVLGMGANLNLKNYLSPVDLGGRLLFGFTIKGFYGEISATVGILDFDKFSGTRRSANLRGMLGYRFP